MERLALTRHPKGSRARVLLTSVFGPYARDDEYGSRAINPMELYHNQVTRVQGPFSLRMFHRSWGLMLIQANLEAPCTLLDFPTLERFDRGDPLGHVRRRGHQLHHAQRAQGEADVRARPAAPAEGHHRGGRPRRQPAGAARPDRRRPRRRAARAWRGFARSWAKTPRHPSGTRRSCPPSARGPWACPSARARATTAATVIPSVGCPIGCNFCSTSAMFGGKGRFFNFYETGDELFEVMCGLEQALGVALLLRDGRELPAAPQARPAAARADGRTRQGVGALRLQLGQRAAARTRSSSWSGWASPGSGWASRARTAAYAKLKGIDTLALVRRAAVARDPRARLEHHRAGEHTPENIDAAIDYAVAPRHRLPPVHALHADARARRCTPSTRRNGDAALRRSECPDADIARAARASTTATRTSRTGEETRVPAARLPRATSR